MEHVWLQPARSQANRAVELSILISALTKCLEVLALTLGSTTLAS